MAIFEKTGSLVAGTALSGFAAPGATGGTALAMTGQVMIQPAAPDPDYHLMPNEHHDLVGFGFFFGAGVAAGYTVFRVVIRDIL
jgi:hypothetical protein